MRRGTLLAMIGLTLVMTDLTTSRWEVQAQQGRGASWIWFNEGDPAKQAPAESRFFRRTFDLGRTADEAFVDLTADKQFTLWVNGTLIGKGNDPKRVYRFDVIKHVGPGKNVVAIETVGSGGPSGLLVRVSYVPTGQSVIGLTGDASWKSAKSAAEGWQKADFDESKWTAAKVLGAYGKVGPWKGLVWDAGGDDRFSVPPGFRVEQVIKEPLSLVNLCFDNKGRLLVSQEGGAILLCSNPGADGLMQSVKPYCDQVKNCQGMCWVKDALLLVGNGPQGTGLYRVRDTDGDDKTDKVEILHKFRGGMGEHGPHAIIHGPDDWLYLVIGNHSWTQIGPKNPPNPDKLAANSPLLRWPTGYFGPDQGKPNTTEDVLLPRLNDSRGHAANILAPGGTIWRLDQNGQNVSLVTAGFRNHFDASFSPNGELFTFDSDMEWDEALPWYRAVRVCHCTPGADFVWRTGAANTPEYYIDSLPTVVETGRGSPVGTEFYDHQVFPAKYRGVYFMADWSIGVIWAVHLERQGATYKGKTERFCSGSPLNVTDLVVGPDGALYFTMGGRGSQGGVQRIVYADGKLQSPGKDTVQNLLDQPQPLSAWGRLQLQEKWKRHNGLISDKSVADPMALELLKVAESPTRPVRDRLRALDALQNNDLAIPLKLLVALLADKQSAVRAHAVYLLGVSNYKLNEDGYKAEGAALLKTLQDDDAFVRRRACEALIRAGVEPPVEGVWPLLGDADRFVRTAARLVLQRIDPKKWVERLWKEKNFTIALEGIVALCKIHQAAPHAADIFRLLRIGPPEGNVQLGLDWLRTFQLALMHTTDRPKEVQEMARTIATSTFPHKDWRMNREAAIVLTHLRREKQLNIPVHALLLKDLLRVPDDRMQQIHYFYCLRLLHEGWSVEEKDQLLAWFDTTKSWTGGHSFTPFLENILKDLNPIFTAEDRVRVISRADQWPRTASVLLRFTPSKELPPPKVLAEMYDKLATAKPTPAGTEMKAFIIEGLSLSGDPVAYAALRKIADKEPGQRDAVARALLKAPTAENWPYLVRGLQTTSQPLLMQLVQTLRKAPTKPKADEPLPFRTLLLASERLEAKQRWQVVELMRHWTGRQFGAERPEEWKEELGAFTKWFVQSFPKEPPLPNLVADKPVESKYKFEELLEFLDKDPSGKGDATRGKLVFEKAQCIKCHKYGKEGEGIGPDLSTVSKRFKRFDTLEALYFPSKAISDQYRSVVIETKSGMTLIGLAAPQGDIVTLLLQDGSKMTLKKDDISQQFASLVSVMPEKLLDMLSKQEIADLFAYMESEP